MLNSSAGHVFKEIESEFMFQAEDSSLKPTSVYSFSFQDKG